MHLSNFLRTFSTFFATFFTKLTFEIIFLSQHESDVCQYVDGDCTIRYEFVHKQIMQPTTPQTTLEWKSLGPQYFCNSWSGNGRSSWVRFHTNKILQFTTQFHSPTSQTNPVGNASKTMVRGGFKTVIPNAGCQRPGSECLGWQVPLRVEQMRRSLRLVRLPSYRIQGRIKEDKKEELKMMTMVMTTTITMMIEMMTVICVFFLVWGCRRVDRPRSYQTISLSTSARVSKEGSGTDYRAK